jgi:hypothetical protein
MRRIAACVPVLWVTQLVLLACHTATGQALTYDYTGAVVDTLVDPASDLAGVEVGDPVSGIIRFDPSADAGMFAGFAFYAHAPQPGIVSMTIGEGGTGAELVIMPDPLDVDAGVVVFDDAPGDFGAPPFDGLAFFQLAVSDDVELGVVPLLLAGFESSVGLYDDDSLPAAIDLDDFDYAFVSIDTELGYVDAEITTLTLRIPEPGSAVLAMAGIFIVALRNRRLAESIGTRGFETRCEIVRGV